MTPGAVKRYAAAGGVVLDGDRVLVLRRTSRAEVRLPKGHVEAGETDVEAAIREVGEETGCTDVEVLADLGGQDVAFTSGDHRVEREERCFLLRLVGPGQRPRNHKDRKLDPVWMSWDEALAAMTFEPEREWLRRARAAAVKEG